MDSYPEIVAMSLGNAKDGEIVHGARKLAQT